MQVVPVLLTLQVLAGADAPSPDVLSAKAAAVRARVDSGIRVFQLAWRDAWRDAERDRRPPRWKAHFFQFQRRGFAVHCHWIATPLSIKRHLIAGSVRAHSACPLWSPEDEPLAGDERHGIDASLQPGAQLRVAVLRRNLLALLDSAAAALPGDLFVSGQRVRFAIDADDLTTAALAAGNCDADPARCGLLQGYVLLRVGLVAAADSAFLAAAALMAEGERCRWNDIGLLLEPEHRRRYRALPCAARSAREAAFWWLSDPLYIEPGNERRAEHFARKVRLVLQQAIGEDERQRWTPEHGGPAAEEALVRYGWPSRMYWGGQRVDLSHGGWLAQHGADTAPPYVVREYTRGRLHPVPAQSALDEPFAATAGDWQLAAPAEDEDWWPREHYARDGGGIVQLPDGQWAMLRRRDHARFVWAGALDPPLPGRARDAPLEAELLEGRTVGEMTRAGRFAARAGGRLLVDAPLAEGRALIAVEVSGDSVQPAARTRFGVHVAAPLAALGRGRALSQPLLYDPPADAGAELSDDAAIARMLGTTTLGAQRRVGVYWEAYGFAPDDTIDIEVQVSREDRPGVLARVAGVILLRRDGDAAGVGLGWREPPGSRRALEHREGTVTVQMRSFVLDLSRLPRGRYTMTLLMRAAGHAPVSGTRAFTLR